MDGANLGDGGSDDESSSSSNIIYEGNHGNHVPSLAVELDQFRQNWRAELRRSHSPVGVNDGIDGKPLTVEEKSRQYYMKGVEEERSGHFQRAVYYYRLAIQLVPDIEQKIETQYNNENNTITRVRQESESSVDSSSEPGALASGLEDDTDDEDNSDIDNLPLRFHRLKVTQYAICHPMWDQAAAHISDLPGELLVYIFKWVVSSDLDLHSLEQLTLVCRGFYLCARDEEIWRLACVRVWGRKCGRPTEFGNWRQMYLFRPRPHYGGCYISRMSYLRHGEKGLDNLYRPVFIVEYYRYLRLFPGGLALMVTSSEDPNVTVSRLRSEKAVITGLLVGRYHILGNQVTILFKRQPANQNNPRNRRTVTSDTEQTFHCDLVVCGRKNLRLKWHHFSVHTLTKSTGQENVCEIDLNLKNYPALTFAKVRSYTSWSNNPLQ